LRLSYDHPEYLFEARETEGSFAKPILAEGSHALLDRDVLDLLGKLNER